MPKPPLPPNNWLKLTLSLKSRYNQPCLPKSGAVLIPVLASSLVLLAREIMCVNEFLLVHQN